MVWKNEEGRRAAIVQSVNASDRTALILLTQTRTLETVSVLELDPYGNFENNATGQPMTDGFGVRRSDFVFIHPEGTTNGFEAPQVPKIGELEAWIHDEVPSLDPPLTGWRKDMHELGKKIAAQRSRRSRGSETMMLPIPRDSNLHWFGEVTGVGNSLLSTAIVSNVLAQVEPGWYSRSNTSGLDGQDLSAREAHETVRWYRTAGGRSLGRRRVRGT